MSHNSIVRRLAALVILMLMGLNTAWAVATFTVRDIRIEGLQRVEPGTVFASLALRVGDDYTDDKGATAIRALFALGLFKDVRLEVSGDVLVVIVEERPNVSEVDFVGTKEFDKDVLKKALRDIGLSDGRPFDRALLDRAEQELKRQYINRSLYAADVVSTVTPIERNRVNITFTVTEGEPAKISEIRIVGNKAFTEPTLRNLFDLDTGGWMSWYTKSNRYSRSKLNADIETLRSYYLARGYLEFRVESTQVAISTNKKDISITINIVEGEKFVVSSVKLDGNYLEREEEFRALVSIKPGEAYNATRVAETIKSFSDYFARFGFAFARVQSLPEIDRARNQVALVLQADPSRRAYVRRLNVAGNNKTRDEVVRREFRQLEASWYDGEKIKLSRSRVDRLGYFKDVDIETNEVPGTSDQVDLTMNVTEKPTGSLTLGAGFSSSDGLGLSFGINQQNAFGSGNSLGMQVNTSSFNRSIIFNTTDPYFTDAGVSRTFDLYLRTFRPFFNRDSYRLETAGTSMRFGVPFSELDTVFFGVGVERTTIVPGTFLPTSFQTYADEFGFASTALPLTVGWARDSRDSALVPTKGILQSASGDWSVGGEVRYLRMTYGYQQFLPITKQYTFAFNGNVALGMATEGRSYPIFKNFYGGGLGSVRGFSPGSLGPKDPTTLVALGGTKRVNANFELQAPFPGTGNDRTLRMYGFVDTGNVYGVSESIDFNQLRASAGVGISWISPIGPLRLAFASPIRSFEGDRIQNIQFQIGTSF
jgi:outer membrane protein insertion porin family